MSSIRDALKKAERERQERLAAAQRRQDEVEAEKTSSPSAPASADLHVVSQPQIPTIEVPVDFTQELALFRHGVEAAIPKPRRSLVMSAAASGEGVTTITAFLGTSLAVRDGKKTVIIDANFKSPKMSNLFGLLGRVGFSDYCSGRAELSDVLCKTDSQDLFFMGLGTDVYNPSLVLSTDRARGLASELTQRFDYVLFDSGSVLTHAETSMLASTADGVVLVVRAHKTKREVLGKAEKLIRFSGGTVIGSVLNRRVYPIPESIYKRL